MDAKDTWPVVKFIIAATGLKRREARQAIEKIPQAKYSDLYLCARAWDRDAGMKATEQLREILGGDNLNVLAEATRRAMIASHMQEHGPVGDDDDSDDEPQDKRTPKRRRHTTR